jgi:predicted metalloprotease with PDZ domain
MIGDAEYARRLSGTLTTVITDPGRRFFSPLEMSMQAPFVDAAASIDPTNQENTFISYYTWGSALGLGLDLTLRARFPGTTLDDYMRAMWRRYGKPGIPYTLDDLENTLGEVTGDPDFAHTFFQRYVLGRDVVDYESLLDRAGFTLRRSNAGQPTLGRARLGDAPGGAVVASNTLIGSPLYEAGVDRGDLIVGLDGRRIAGADDLRRALANRRPGDVVPIVFQSEGGRRTASVTLTENPAVEVVPSETIAGRLTPERQAFRNDWLGSRAR